MSAFKQLCNSRLYIKIRFGIQYKNTLITESIASRFFFHKISDFTSVSEYAVGEEFTCVSTMIVKPKMLAELLTFKLYLQHTRSRIHATADGIALVITICTLIRIF